jgi:hypothetical protein
MTTVCKHGIEFNAHCRQCKVEDVRKKVLATGGKIFRVTFTKRTTGERRVMVARLNVKKHLKGGQQSYVPKDHDLVTCFDMERMGYRTIPLDSVEELRARNRVHRWKPV